MKRNLALMTAAGLTVFVVAVILIAMTPLLVEPTGSQQTNQTASPATVAEPLAEPARPVEVPTMTQTFNQDVERMIQQRESALQAQVAQRQKALADLDETSQARVNELQAQLLALQGQIEQKKTGIVQLQTNVTALQQTIQNDDAVYQREVATLAETEQQLRLELETAQAQLSAAYSEMAQRQAAAAENNAGSSRQSDDHNERHDDDDDDDDDHHEDDDDDDGDRHEDDDD